MNAFRLQHKLTSQVGIVLGGGVPMIDRQFLARASNSLLRGSFVQDAYRSLRCRVSHLGEVPSEDPRTTTRKFLKSHSSRRQWRALERLERAWDRSRPEVGELYDQFGPAEFVNRIRSLKPPSKSL